jgi:hypothetical protein
MGDQVLEQLPCPPTRPVRDHHVVEADQELTEEVDG